LDFSKLPAPAFDRQRNGFSFTAATLTERGRRAGLYYRVVARMEPAPGKTRRWQFGKKSSPGVISTQKRTLKMQLKFRRGTSAVGEYCPQVFHGLQQGIGLLTERRRLFPAKLGANQEEPVPQSAPQPIDRFERKRQPQFFRCCLQ